MSSINIQINNIQIHRLSEFPEQRINQLISELNVHYGKISSYLDAGISQEKIDIELIESLAKLEEIHRLSPRRIQQNTFSGDFRLGIAILESIITLLNTRSGHNSTRNKFLKLGWDLLFKLYSHNYEKIKNEALLFNWLKRHDLVRGADVSCWNHRAHDQNNNRMKFSPSDVEVEEFYEKNKLAIYKYMVYNMGPNEYPSDPFSQPDVADFYHYHQTLSNISTPREA